MSLSLLGAHLVVAACTAPDRSEGARSGKERSVDGGTDEDAPTGALEGTIRGRAFRLDQASLDNITLDLQQGSGFDVEARVSLFLFPDDRYAVPAGQRVDVTCEGSVGEAGSPHIHLTWLPEGEESTRSDNVTCGYDLDLRFGETTPRGTLPTSLRLEVESLGIDLEGTFETEVDGFRLVDGEPDLGQDDLAVLRVLAVSYLEETLGHPVELVDVSSGRLRHPSEQFERQEGFGVYWWKRTTQEERSDPWEDPYGIDEVAHDGFVKLQFVKADGRWSVHRVLESWRLPAAHPVEESGRLGASLDRRAALETERALRAEGGERTLFQARVRTGYNPTSGVAVTTVETVRDEQRARELSGFFSGDEPVDRRRHLFRLTGEDSRDPGDWELVRVLEEGEEVDMATGEITTASP